MTFNRIFIIIKLSIGSFSYHFFKEEYIMKKIISVFLAALMLMSCLGVAGVAADGECTCGVGVHVDNQPCDCCVYCPNVDVSKMNTCYREGGAFCCADCDGMYGCGCNCGCKYCATGDQDINDDNSNLGDIITEEDKEQFVDGFQAILKKISDFFDMVFDAIFEFLRIGEVIGNGDTPEA